MLMKYYLIMTDKELALILRDYMLMHHEMKESDVIFVLGSHDTQVADRAVELYFQGYAPYILFSGAL